MLSRQNDFSINTLEFVDSEKKKGKREKVKSFNTNITHSVASQ